MDGPLSVALLSAALLAGSFLIGLIPVLISFSQQKMQFVSVLGAGLLCGTALAVIIPEGVELVEQSWRDSYCSVITTQQNSTGSDSTLEPPAEKGPRPHFFIGVSLVLGFTLMFVVDQIADYCSARASRTSIYHGSGITVTLGLLIHAAADGVALGAAVASSQASVQVIVFFAVILHKAPAAFGLVSFLMHAGLERSTIQKHLLAFSAAAPLLAVSTYFIISMTGGSAQHRLSATGIGMLVSAGTFLYVATVHVLPEVNSRGQQRTAHFQHHAGPGPVHQQTGLSILESITLITGAALPVLLALGLPDD